MPPLKGLYYTSVDEHLSKNKRIISKCLGQIGAFEDSGIQMDFVRPNRAGLWLNDELIDAAPASNNAYRWAHKWSKYHGHYKLLLQKLDVASYDVIYFRHSFFTPRLLRFFKEIKKRNPTIQIIVEISTHPYAPEFDGYIKKALLQFDQYTIKRLPKYVNYIASCSAEKWIAGMPVLRFSNAMLSTSNPTQPTQVSKNSKELKCVALASNVSDWHAYDRVIRGIANYNSTHRGVSITLDIIGAGTAIDKLTQLTKTLGQEDAINFVGPIEEEQIIAHLSQHYDLAFSTLGMHRKGVDYDSSMKSRDFCLAGLPFVLAADDFSFPKEKPYWMYAPQNDSAIDMERCLAFFNDLKIQHPHYHTEMTQYALTALGWDNCFAGIIAKIKAIKKSPLQGKRFFAFCYYYPPIKAIGSMRTYNVVKHFKANGCEPVVFTTSNRERVYNQEPLPTHSLTIPLPTWDFKKIYWLISSRRKKPQQPPPPIKKTNKPHQAHHSNLIFRMLSSFPFFLLFGEGGLIYIINGIRRGLRNIPNNSVVFSSYMPYADHVIAYVVKSMRNDIFWIADFRDLHVDPVRKDLILIGLQRYFNKKILKKANIVTTVSEGLKTNIQPFHSNIQILRNGISEMVVSPETVTEVKKLTPYFNISYTGSIHTKQNPRILFEAISELIADGKLNKETIRINYAGQHEHVFEQYLENLRLEDNFNNYGLVNREWAIALQSASQLNLLLSWSTAEVKGILTGKFYEYLYWKAPVAVLINGIKDEEFEALLDQTKIGHAFYPADKEKLKLFILQIVAQWHNDKSLSLFKQQVNPSAYNWSNIVDKFIQDIQNEKP